MNAKLQSIIRPQQGGPRDPDRLQLAIAISARDAAAKKVTEARASIGRAHLHADQCDERLASATAAGVAARDALARRATESAVGGTVLAPDSTMRAARLDEQDCEDSLAAAKEALSACEAFLEEPADALRQAEKRASEAAKAVLSRHIPAAISDVVRAKAALFDAISVLHLLKTSCVEAWPPSSEESRLRSYLQIPARNGVVFEIDYEANRGSSQRWAEFYAHLLRDADAAPPSI
jgi:hypothetical protein